MKTLENIEVKTVRANSHSSLFLAGALLFLVSLSMYCAGVSKTALEPINADEPYFFYAAESFNARGTFDCLMNMTQVSARSPLPQTENRATIHPPALIFSIAKMGKLVGDYVFGARLLGVFWVLATTATLMLLSFRVFEKHAARAFWTWLVGALYLAHPVAVKSATAIDSDQSTFTFAFALFTFVLFRFLQNRKTAFIPVLGLAWLVCLFAKVTASVLVPAILMLFLALHFKKFPKGQIVLLLAMFPVVLGVFLFLLHLLDFPGWVTLNYVGGQFHHMTTSSPVAVMLRKSATSFIITLAWMGPVLIFLLWGAIGAKVRDYWKGTGDLFTDFLCIAAFAFVFGHMVVGFTYNQFPRYMTPALPGLCLIAVWFLARFSGQAAPETSRGLGVWAAILLGCTLWYWLGVGDYLHTLIFKPRALWLGQWAGNSGDLVRLAGWQFFAYFLPFLIWAGWLMLRRRPGLWMALVPVLLGSYWGMDIIQRQAAYGTYYLYGESGKWQVTERTNSLPPDRAIMGTYPFVYYKGDNVSLHHLERDWYDDENFVRIVRDPGTEAIVYGVMEFPVSLARHFQSPEMVSLFASEGYTKENIGSYTIWQRSGANPQP